LPASPSAMAKPSGTGPVPPDGGPPGMRGKPCRLTLGPALAAGRTLSVLSLGGAAAVVSSRAAAEGATGPDSAGADVPAPAESLSATPHPSGTGPVPPDGEPPAMRGSPSRRSPPPD